MSTVLDPMAAAVQDAESASHYFGKMQVDAQFVILKKGQSKQVWSEGMDTDGRTTEVALRLNPIDASGLTKMVERQVISNSGEWSRIVWPSLRDLGVKQLRDIEGQWAHIQMVPSGRTWLGKPDENGDRPTVTGTTFKFVKLFTLESDCEKAWEELAGKEAHTSASNGTTPATSVSQVSDAGRATALQFLPALVKMANGNRDVLAQTIATMPQISPYFTVDSPEIVELLKAA
jgi:hypothetical protein